MKVGQKKTAFDSKKLSQPAIKCSTLAIGILGQGVKYSRG